MTDLVGTLTENIIMGKLLPNKTFLVKPTVKAAPFTEGCVVMTTKLFVRSFRAPPPNLVNGARRLTTLLGPDPSLRTPLTMPAKIVATLMGLCRLVCPPRRLPTSNTPFLMSLKTLSMARLPGPQVSASTLPLAATNRCRADSLCMCRVQVARPNKAVGSRSKTLVKQSLLFVSPSSPRVLS